MIGKQARFAADRECRQWPSRLDRPEGLVDLWLLEVDREPPDSWLQLLSEDERARHDRLHFARDRRQFLAAHALLREVLALYTGQAASRLEFFRGSHGKPSLAGGPAFNLSHSGPWCVLAVGDVPDIGVDVEAHRPSRRFSGLARQCFAPSERRAFEALAEAEQADHFYRLWTLKESFIKAAGKGLSMPLRQFAFDCDLPRGRLDLAFDPALEERHSDWGFHSLDALPGASLACCSRLPVEAMPPAVRGRRCWPGEHWAPLDWEPRLEGHYRAALC